MTDKPQTPAQAPKAAGPASKPSNDEMLARRGLGGGAAAPRAPIASKTVRKA